MAADPLACRRSHGGTPIGIAGKPMQRRGERRRIVRRDEQAGYTVDHLLRHPADGGRHHRQAGAHRLENVVGETFVMRCADVDVRGGQDRRDIGTLAEKTNMR